MWRLLAAPVGLAVQAALGRAPLTADELMQGFHIAGWLATAASVAGGELAVAAARRKAKRG